MSLDNASRLLEKGFRGHVGAGLGHKIPADRPVQAGAGGKRGIGPLLLDFDEGLAGVGIDLDLRFGGCCLAGLEVLELLDEEQSA